jgi:hypothetical protein
LKRLVSSFFIDKHIESGGNFNLTVMWTPVRLLSLHADGLLNPNVYTAMLNSNKYQLNDHVVS